jgi:hypothetical protein
MKHIQTVFYVSHICFALVAWILKYSRCCESKVIKHEKIIVNSCPPDGYLNRVSYCESGKRWLNMIDMLFMFLEFYVSWETDFGIFYVLRFES